MGLKALDSFKKQASFHALAQLVTKAKGFILLPIITRLIGEEGYGVLAALLATIAFIQTFLSFGLSTAIQVYFPSLKSMGRKAEDFWSIAIVLNLLSVAVITVLAFIQYEWSSEYGYFLIALCQIPFFLMNGLFYAVTVSEQMARDYSKVLSFSTLVEFVVVLLLAFLYGLKGILFGYVSGQMVQLMLYLFFLRDELPLKWPSFKFSILKKYYQYGGHVFIGGMAALSIDQSDRLFLEYYRGHAETGIYFAAYQLCLPLVSISAPLFPVLMPTMVKAISDNNMRASEYYAEKSFRWLSIVFLPCVVFVILCKNELLLILPETFRSGTIVIPTIIVAIAIHQMTGVYTTILHARKKAKIIAFSYVITSLLNIVLNFLWIPEYGMTAAAISTLVAYVIHYFICNFFAMRVHPGFPVLKTLLHCGCAGFLMTMVVMLSRMMFGSSVLKLAVSLVMMATVYLSYLWVSKMINQEEWDAMILHVKLRFSKLS